MRTTLFHFGEQFIHFPAEGADESQTPCLREKFTQGSTACGSRAPVRAQTWVFPCLRSNQLTTPLFQLTKYGWAPLSSLSLSGNGYSRTIHERQESAACYQIPRPPALAMMNKPILGLRKSDPADPACRGTSILISAITFVAIWSQS